MDDNVDAPVRAELPKRRKYNYLPLSERYRLAGQLMLHSKDGRLPKGIVSFLASDFNVGRATVYRIWKKVLNGLITGRLDLTTNKNKCGRKPHYNMEILQSKIVALPPWKRMTVRRSAGSLGIPRSTFQFMVKNKGLAMRHSNTTKPLLTEKNKEDRLKFAMDFVPDERTGVVKPIFDCAHIDEKHFLIFKEKASYYLVPDEEAMIRRCKSKRFVTKVMFLCCVARPRLNRSTGEYFDGKIGIYPFVHKVEAKRNSKNREKGTLETKPDNVTRDVSRVFLRDKVFPDIRAKWPRWYFASQRDKSRKIVVQQDNARPHCLPNDPEIVAAGTVGGYNIVLNNQPANSPDLNVLDLGIFNAIDKLQQSMDRQTVDELFDAVVASLNLLSAETIERSFMTLQAVIGEVVASDGDNSYRMPHLRKSIIMKVFGEIPEYVRLKPTAMERARVFRQQERARLRAIYLELFGEEEDEPEWLFQPVFGPVAKVYQL